MSICQLISLPGNISAGINQHNTRWLIFLACSAQKHRIKNLVCTCGYERLFWVVHPRYTFSENMVRSEVDVGIFYDNAQDFVGNLENCDFSWHHFGASCPHWTHK